MKKRIVSALLVCVLGMSLVTGCGNNAKAAETTKTADGKIQCIHESSGPVNNVCVSVRDANWPYYRRLIE